MTFRVLSGALAPDEVGRVLDHIKEGNDRFYTLVAATVLPDHVHLLIEPRDGYPVPRVMKGIKGASARTVNRMRGTRGSLWQDESFDRIVRNQAELNEKLTYMLNNAVKRGLVAEAWDWSGWYFNEAAYGRW